MRDKKPKRYSPYSTLPMPTKPMNKVNHERRKRLRARQFGETGEGLSKGEWIRGMLCGVTGQRGTEEYPVDACHVGSPDPDERGQSSRGAGADDTYIFPMRREVHRAFDSLDAARFEEVFGVSKLWVRQMAATLNDEWIRLCRAPLPDSQTEDED